MLCLSWQEEGANRRGVGRGHHAVNSRDSGPSIFWGASYVAASDKHPNN